MSFIYRQQVALERVKEYSELKRESAEYIEPRPPAFWPENGAIKCENLVIRYAVCRFQCEPHSFITFPIA
jgi:hypothetical protein